MKIGSKCFVCYDGKYGRRVIGEVIATKQSKILVQFPQYASKTGTILQHWFHRKNRSTRYGGPRYSYAGFVPENDSVMEAMYNLPGSWYRVFKFKQKDAEGCGT